MCLKFMNINGYLQFYPTVIKTYTLIGKIISIAGNRTRVSWVKARYPNRWTTMEF